MKTLQDTIKDLKYKIATLENIKKNKYYIPEGLDIGLSLRSDIVCDDSDRYQSTVESYEFNHHFCTTNLTTIIKLLIENLNTQLVLCNIELSNN